MDFKDSQVIERAGFFSNAYPAPGVPLTPEQEAKLEQLIVLVEEVGAVPFDTEIDILIIAMTEIRNGA
jgi:hypothetical protein